jgi:long-chain acyl-CoA synthetase
MDGATFRWGTEIVRAAGRIPFLQYEPRRRRLPELLQDAARWCGRDHLVQGDRRLSFEQFLAATSVVADDLARRGVTAGQRVLLLAPNSPEWVVALWGGLLAGAVVAPGNGWWSEAEVDHAVRLIDPALVIGDPKRLAKVPSGTTTVGVDEIRALVDGVSPSPGVEPATPLWEAGDENEPALIVFTSGTTGLPKGATLAHRSVIANLHNLLAVSKSLPHDMPAGAGHVSLLTGPLFHIGGIQALSRALVTGGTLVFLEGRFEPAAVLDLIEREHVDVWGAVPTMALRVLNDPSRPGRDLSTVRSVSLGGAPVAPELVGQLRQAFPNADRGVSTVYGMTEAGGTVAAASGRVMAAHPGTSGRPLAVVDLRIDNPDDDGVGEIVVRTPGQMLGYWDEASDAVIDADGFLRTGDLGRLEDGLLYITGRSKDIVIRGGENIAAPHVEAVLLQHPAVSEAAVIGLPHPDLGEEVAAALVGRAGTDLDPDEVARFVTDRLAHFEVPTRWWIWAEPLPTNDAGKLDKRFLQASWPAPPAKDRREHDDDHPA